MSRRLKTVEELNKETVVELTVEEKVQAFEEWLNKKLNICESSLSGIIQQLEHCLSKGEPMNEDTFNNKIEVEYFFINEKIREAKWTCQKEKLPENVLTNAISEFKQVKSKMRKVKAEYKQKFIELKKAIALAQENEDYVSKIRNHVKGIITGWCDIYVIMNYYKASFEGDRLSETVDYVTGQVLNSKLNPSEEDVVKFVEGYMESRTEKVNDTSDEVKRSPEYTACEREINSICFSISSLIFSVKRILDDVIPADTVEQVQPMYMESLKKTMDFAIDDVEKLIVKNNVTDEQEIASLKSMVTKLMDDSLFLCYQG